MSQAVSDSGEIATGTSASRSGDFGRFFLPGPTEVRPEILAEQLRAMIGHRGSAMEALLDRIAPGLQYVFRTERPVWIATSSATGFMEGAIRNAVKRSVLCLVNGAFSERFFRIARACGVSAQPLEVALGQAHSPDMLAHALADGDFDAVTVVHSETSTGALNPIADLAGICRQAGDVVLLVDSVTGVAGAPVESDAWALDFVLTGSQKSLALPPGLAFGVAQDSVLERARERDRRGVYFDFLEFEKATAKKQTPNTPAVSLLFALAAQLDRIRSETIEGRWARHDAMAQRTHGWVREMSEAGIALGVLAPEGARSPTVTCVTLPPGSSGPAVSAAAKARGWTIATGYGPLRESSIRIGHMGDHTVGELDELLDVIAGILRP